MSCKPATTRTRELMQFCPDTSPPVLAGKRITWFCPVYKKKDDTKLTFHGDSDDDDVSDGVYDDDSGSDGGDDSCDDDHGHNHGHNARRLNITVLMVATMVIMIVMMP